MLCVYRLSPGHSELSYGRPVGMPAMCLLWFLGRSEDFKLCAARLFRNLDYTYQLPRVEVLMQDAA